jgi:hypothetical protein
MHQIQGYPFIFKKKETLMVLRAQIGANTVIVGTPHHHQQIGHPDKRLTKKLQSYSTHYTK